MHLHRTLHVNPSQDLVTAWDYIDHKRKMYVWSDVKRTMQYAFTVKDAAELLGVHKMTLFNYMSDGKIEKPQRIYDLSTRKPGKYFFSEEDVMDIHLAMSETHQGRPRKDGLVTNNGVPNRAQVRTLVRQGDVLYTKTEDGEFVPIWKEQMW